MDRKTLQKADECITRINNAENNLAGIEEALKEGEIYRLEFYSKNHRPVRIMGEYHGDEGRYDEIKLTPQLRKFLEAEKTRLTADLEAAELEFENL